MSHKATTSPSMTRSFLPLMLWKSARIISVVSNTVLAAAAEHERHVIGERTRHALAAAKARGISSAIQSRPRSIGRRRPRGLQRCARTSSAASRQAAHRAVPSQPISTRAASRHPMVSDAGSSRPRSSRPMIDRGVQNLGVGDSPAGRGTTLARGLRIFRS
jgi:hypothetical protein